MSNKEKRLFNYYIYCCNKHYLNKRPVGRLIYYIFIFPFQKLGSSIKHIKFAHRLTNTGKAV